MSDGGWDLRSEPVGKHEWRAWYAAETQWRNVRSTWYRLADSERINYLLMEELRTTSPASKRRDPKENIPGLVIQKKAQRGGFNY